MSNSPQGPLCETEIHGHPRGLRGTCRGSSFFPGSLTVVQGTLHPGRLRKCPSRGFRCPRVVQLSPRSRLQPACLLKKTPSARDRPPSPSPPAPECPVHSQPVLDGSGRPPATEPWGLWSLLSALPRHSAVSGPLHTIPFVLGRMALPAFRVSPHWSASRGPGGLFPHAASSRPGCGTPALDSVKRKIANLFCARRTHRSAGRPAVRPAAQRPGPCAALSGGPVASLRQRGRAGSQAQAAPEKWAPSQKSGQQHKLSAAQSQTGRGEQGFAGQVGYGVDVPGCESRVPGPLLSSLLLPSPDSSVVSVRWWARRLVCSRRTVTPRVGTALAPELCRRRGPELRHSVSCLPAPSHCSDSWQASLLCKGRRVSAVQHPVQQCRQTERRARLSSSEGPRPRLPSPCRVGA